MSAKSEPTAKEKSANQAAEKKTLDLAREPVAVASSLKFSRLVDIAAHLGGKR